MNNPNRTSVSGSNVSSSGAGSTSNAAGEWAALGAAVAQATSSGGRSATAPTAAIPYGKGGGGGGGDTPNEPPGIASPKGSRFVITAHGPGNYVINNPVPIGSIMELKTVSPYPAFDAAGTITSRSWSGGSDFSGAFSSGYFSTPANAAAPQSQSAPQAPVTTDPTYYFIVDATPQPYSIILNVNYQKDGSGTSTLQFTSVAPTGSLKVTQVGTQTWGVAKVMLSPPIVISATSSVGQFTSGQFMFMQIVTSSYRQSTDPTGQSWYLANTAAFPGFDWPLFDTLGTTGVPYHYQTYGPGAPFSWSLPDSNGNTSMPTPAPWMSDSPTMPAPAANDLRVSVSDSFSTYLMYQPSVQGVWIALSQINWSWSEAAATNAGVWYGPQPTLQPTPAAATTPAGEEAFPTWVNTSPIFLSQNPIKGG